MPDTKDLDYLAAMKELHEATNALRELRGEPPTPFVMPEAPCCSFCGKGKNEVRAMVAGEDGIYRVPARVI